MTFEGKDTITTFYKDPASSTVAVHLSVLNISEPMAEDFWSKFGTSIRESTYFTNELWAQLIIPFDDFFVLSKEKKAV
jgi:hypothetical protein